MDRVRRSPLVRPLVVARPSLAADLRRVEGVAWDVVARIAAAPYDWARDDADVAS